MSKRLRRFLRTIRRVERHRESVVGGVLLGRDGLVILCCDYRDMFEIRLRVSEAGERPMLYLVLLVHPESRELAALRTRRSGDVVRVRYRTHGGIVREVLS